MGRKCSETSWQPQIIVPHSLLADGVIFERPTAKRQCHEWKQVMVVLEALRLTKNTSPEGE